MDAPEINQICILNNKDCECGLFAVLHLKQLHIKDGFEYEDLG